METTKVEKKDAVIRFRVTKEEKNLITQLADSCGLSLSSYVLARALNHQPRFRLTEEEMEALKPLKDFHSDLQKYMGALSGMNPKSRQVFFNNFQFMAGWLERLDRTGKEVDNYLKKLRNHDC